MAMGNLVLVAAAASAFVEQDLRKKLIALTSFIMFLP